MASFRGPDLGIAITIPDNVPKAFVPVIQPIYVAFHNIVQVLVRYAGIGPRNASDVLLSNGDPTAILTNNTHRFYIQASENISEGALVNLYNNGVGILEARNANATNYTKPTHGFCSQPGGITAGAIGEVIVCNGVITGLSGLLVGSEYFMSTVAGTLTNTPPVAAGNLEQEVGVALSSTTLLFYLGRKIFH